MIHFRQRSASSFVGMDSGVAVDNHLIRVKLPNVGNPSSGTAVVVATRACSFINDHLHDTIRIQDLCDHTGVGARTLQRCFALCLQLTPTRYSKERRLDAARRDLLAGDPDADSVGEIAMRNGLRHWGRFSGEYRARFGESPRETLAKPLSSDVYRAAVAELIGAASCPSSRNGDGTRLQVITKSG